MAILLFSVGGRLRNKYYLEIAWVDSLRIALDVKQEHQVCVKVEAHGFPWRRNRRLTTHAAVEFNVQFFDAISELLMIIC